MVVIKDSGISMNRYDDEVVRKVQCRSRDMDDSVNQRSQRLTPMYDAVDIIEICQAF